MRLENDVMLERRERRDGTRTDDRTWVAAQNDAHNNSCDVL